MANFQLPTEFTIQTIKIDGIDIIGKFMSISVWEDIYRSVLTGSIILLDTDGSNFIEKNDIEGNEEIEFEFTNARDEQLTFKGYLNGLRNRTIKNQKIAFTFDFTSEAVRENEITFVTEKFQRETPRDIVEDMVTRMGSELINSSEAGVPMEFVGSRKRPADIIKYVLTHGVTGRSSVQDEGKGQTGESTGTAGFMCWETLQGHKFASVDGVLSGAAGKDAGTFQEVLANTNLSLDQLMNIVIESHFKRMGDMQAKLRSGAFNHINISMDLDKGLYKEIEYKFDEGRMTEKQKKAAKKPSRVLFRPISNERFSLECFKAPDNQHDQSRKSLSQNIGRQNTFDDQLGEFTLPPQFDMNAGDIIEVKLPKVIGEGEGGYDEKHSGRYVVRQVGHHIFSDGRAYTKIKTIRSSTQQDDATSRQV